MARTTGPAGRSVASKLVAIVDAFAEGPSQLRLSDVARRTGLPTSTVARHLVDLEGSGWLRRSPGDGRYEIGLRLWELGALAPQKRTLRDAAFPHLQDLYEISRQNVQLVVLDELAGLCIERVYGKRAVPTQVDVGDRLPLHASATGKALLAHAPAGVLGALVEDPLPRFTDATITDPAALLVELRRIRETGVAVSQEERGVGVVAVASAILARDRTLLGAVGVVAPSDVVVDRYGLVVRSVALAIGRTFGMLAERAPRGKDCEEA